MSSPVPLPAPAAARLRRPSWRDTRLVVGLLLVLASVALGARVVAAADDTVPVWAARSTLPAGMPLDPDGLTAVRVRLADDAAPYLDARRPPPGGLVLVRSVGAGELVPVSATGPAAAQTRRPLVVPLTGAPAADLRPGGAADVWVSRRDRDAGSGAFGPPERLMAAAEVAAVVRDDESLAALTPVTVELLLEQEQLPAVLDALANGARIALVPVPGSAPPDATP